MKTRIITWLTHGWLPLPLLVVAGLPWTARSAQLLTSEIKLIAGDAAGYDQIGSSVAISGDILVVGAPSGDTSAGMNAGSAYIFMRNETGWSQQAKLTASDGAVGDFFGNSVAISGDTIVVGARSAGAGGSETGSAYVFVRDGANWSQQAKLMSDPPAYSAQFGASVAVGAETIVVGAPLEDGINTDSGVAYVFVREGANWRQQAKLTASDASPRVWFGSAVAIDGETVVVGAIHDGEGSSGSAYVFVRAGTNWNQQAKLTASDGASGDHFGTSVSVSGYTAVIGAPSYRAYMGAPPRGWACVFIRTGTNWTQQQKLAANDAAPGDNFGSSVAISGDTFVVGASYGDTPAGLDAGSAYIYVWNGSIWNQKHKLMASDAAGGDEFGWSVGISGGAVVVGARLADTAGGANAGTAYLYEPDRTANGNQPFAKIEASDAAKYDFFGWAVAMDRDTLVVGTPGDSLDSRPSGGGYVFVRSGTGWREQAKLTVGELWLDRLGASVAISGDTAVVGAPASGGSPVTGAVYVFVRDGSTWSLQANLTGADAAQNDLFGQSVAISGDTLVVGSPENFDPFTETGSAYVFARNGTNWGQMAKLVASDGARADEFGTAVAMDGDTIVVGARGDDDRGLSSGSAYVFVCDGTNWVEQQKLTASDTARSDVFGSSVAIRGDSVVVGAPGHSERGSEAGAIYVFVRNGTVWNLQQEFVADDIVAGDQFGCSVAISGSMVVAAANAKDDQGTNCGAAYLLSNDGTSWNQFQKLTASDAATGDNFGWSVAISDNAVAVGAPLKDTSAGAGVGAAYVFASGSGPRRTGELPPLWQHADIGAEVTPGSTSLTNGTYTIHGSGEDIWGSADEFYFHHQLWIGDGQIVACVTSVENTDPWAKAGVMFRQSLDAASPHAFMMFTPVNGLGFQSRVSVAENSSYTPGRWATAPHWLKLVRKGDTFTGYASSNRVDWLTVGSRTIPMGSTVVVGLAVTAHDNSVLNTSTFTDVRVEAPSAGTGNTVMAQPTKPPRIRLDGRHDDGMVELTVAGEGGHTYAVVASTDLVNWTPISNRLNTNGTMVIPDPEATNHSARFYRAVAVP